MPRPIGIYGSKPDGHREGSAAQIFESYLPLSPLPHISVSPLGRARVYEYHPFARCVTHR